MKFTLIHTSLFAAKWSRLKLTDQDLRALEAALMGRPEAGAVMSGTSGLRKVRFAPPTWHTGKSGAMRVCYSLFPQTIILVTLFAKNEKDNLTNQERNDIASMLRAIAKNFREAK